MAGGAADSQFTGLAKYFNSTTMSGRANVIILSLLSIPLLFVAPSTLFLGFL